VCSWISDACLVSGLVSVVLAAGADHSSGIKPQEYVDRFGMLESWARKRWPQAGKRVYEWSGMVRLTPRRPLRGKGRAHASAEAMRIHLMVLAGGGWSPVTVT